VSEEHERVERLSPRATQICRILDEEHAHPPTCDVVRPLPLRTEMMAILGGVLVLLALTGLRRRRIPYA
jgi:hypothetical protein